MRLNVKTIINAPGKGLDFSFEMDLSDVEFGGLYPIQKPVVVTGHVKNIAGMTVTVGGTELQISQPRKKEFMRALNNYLGSGG